MVLNLKPFTKNYKLPTTNYKAKGTTHDGRNLRAIAPTFFLLRQGQGPFDEGFIGFVFFLECL
ncbi:hypothetical protein I3300191I4_00420 [Megasphaera elsdenii]